MLAATGGVASALGIAGCLGGGSDGEDGTGDGGGDAEELFSGEGNGGAGGDSGGTSSGDTGGSAEGGADTEIEQVDGLAAGGSMPDQLQTALDHVYMPADAGDGGEVPLELRRPQSMQGGESDVADGPVGAGSVEWIVSIDGTQGVPRTVGVGDFADVDLSSNSGVEQAGEVGSLTLYSLPDDRHAGVGESRVLIGDRDWIERVVEQYESDADGVVDRNPAVVDLLTAIDIGSAMTGRVVLNPAGSMPGAETDPDAVAMAIVPQDSGQHRRMSGYYFSGGYDDATAETVQSSFANQPQIQKLSVDRREEMVVLQATAGMPPRPQGGNQPSGGGANRTSGGGANQTSGS